MKQETLEEAAEKYAEGKSSSSVFQEAHKKDFIKGANWQAEKMYSEDEVKDILIRSKTAWYSSIIEWFEQNEKK